MINVQTLGEEGRVPSPPGCPGKLLQLVTWPRRKLYFRRREPALAPRWVRGLGEGGGPQNGLTDHKPADPSFRVAEATCPARVLTWALRTVLSHTGTAGARLSSGRAAACGAVLTGCGGSSGREVQPIPDLFWGLCGDMMPHPHASQGFSLHASPLSRLPTPGHFFPSNQLLKLLHLKQLRRTQSLFGWKSKQGRKYSSSCFRGLPSRGDLKPFAQSNPGTCAQTATWRHPPLCHLQQLGHRAVWQPRSDVLGTFTEGVLPGVVLPTVHLETAATGEPRALGGDGSEGMVCVCICKAHQQLCARV